MIGIGIAWCRRIYASPNCNELMELQIKWLIILDITWYYITVYDTNIYCDWYIKAVASLLTPSYRDICTGMGSNLDAEIGIL